MTEKELILEIYRETDFITEMMVSKNTLGLAEGMVEFKSAMSVKRACSAFLNGEDVSPYLAKFVRKEMELNTYEEMEIWGKFSPPDQIIKYDDES